MAGQHECEWEIKTEIEHGGAVDVWIQCVDKKCHRVEYKEQAESRLNEYETLKRATEKLSAEDAKSSSDILSDFSERLAECQKAYADILKDG